MDNIWITILSMVVAAIIVKGIMNIKDYQYFIKREAGRSLTKLKIKGSGTAYFISHLENSGMKECGFLKYLFTFNW